MDAMGRCHAPRDLIVAIPIIEEIGVPPNSLVTCHLRHRHQLAKLILTLPTGLLLARAKGRHGKVILQPLSTKLSQRLLERFSSRTWMHNGGNFIPRDFSLANLEDPGHGEEGVEIGIICMCLNLALFEQREIFIILPFHLINSRLGARLRVR